MIYDDGDDVVKTIWTWFSGCSSRIRASVFTNDASHLHSRILKLHGLSHSPDTICQCKIMIFQHLLSIENTSGSPQKLGPFRLSNGCRDSSSSPRTSSQQLMAVAAMLTKGLTV